MSVFRVEKTKGYTVMSNHHLRNHALSLKAKGLLSQMLSLPDDWDYTLQGLAQINKESIDAIREAVRELERAGYIKRSRERDERGCLRGTVYTIYEQPHAEPTPEEPAQEKPTLDHPTLEKPMLDFPTLENPTQLNTKRTKKRKRQSKDLSITDSILFPSGFPDAPTQKRTEAKESFERYEGYPRLYIKQTLEVRTFDGQRVPVMAYIMNPELHLKPSLPPRDYYLGIKTGYEQNGLPVGCLKYAFKNCLKECGMEPYPKKVQTKPPQRKEASHER